jgi:cytochrome c oxidase subunit IV
MERDDIIEYSLHAHHSEEAGKKIRKKIWVVTAILTVITVVEVLVGMFFSRAVESGMVWEAIKWGYIVLTLVKAGYIVMVFMHLGDENKSLRYMILVTYFVFIIYAVILFFIEAQATHNVWAAYHN